MLRVIGNNRFICLLCFSFLFAIVGPLLMPAVPSPARAAMRAHDLLFTTSGHCIACHSQVRTSAGEDISTGFEWRASIMANSSRDPYWQASIRREAMDHPGLVDVLEDKCTTCHMPMQRFQARFDGSQGRAFRYLTAIRTGAAMIEPNGNLHRAKEPLAAFAADGVSCTLCHQILPNNLGRPSGLDGGFEIDTAHKEEQRTIFGPFDTPDAGRVRLMHSATGFAQQRGDHVKQAELCATCHTLYTDAFDDQGRPAGRLPEQVPFQEWQHSAYANRQTCQDCHMPAVAGAVPITSIHAQNHEGVKRHTFVGGNAFLLRILEDHGGELGVAALPDELESSARRSEALLAQQSASVTIGSTRLSGGTLSFEVRVENKTGHKLPTAYPSRRAWLHVTVRDANGGVLFESGAVRPDGSIVGNDNDADATRFEPHYSRITSPDQVQIYETIMGDHAERVTTGLLFGTHYLKDNRVLPDGFDKVTADAQVAVVGSARGDPDFRGGSDSLLYSLPLPAGRRAASIQAQLLYESIGYRWAHNLDHYRAAEPQRFVAYFNEQAPNAAKQLANAERMIK